MINQLVIKPTSPQFQLKILDQDDKDQIEEEAMRPCFRRNLIQRYVRFLVVSDNVKDKDMVTEKLKIFFVMFNSLEKVYIENYICSVHEFWHVFAKMRDLPSVKNLINDWNRTCQQFDGSQIDVSWNRSKSIIIFGS